MIDILAILMNKEISEQKAYDIYDEVITKYHNGELQVEPRIELNLDEYEWTAFCHGISLKELAKWRDNGWPKYCARCGAKIDYKQYGWTIKENQLIGLNCCE